MNSNPQVGDIYEKRAHGKTSVNAPRIEITQTRVTTVCARPINFATGCGWTPEHKRQARTMQCSVLERDWRKVSFVEPKP